MEWLSLGASMLSGFMSYQADKAAAKAKRAWQAYSNTMIRLSDAQNQNAITTNEILNQQASTDQAIGIKESNILTTAQAEVSAAAAGVKGRSVDMVMLDINRNAAVAERQRETSLINANLSFDQQRRSSSLQAAMQQDYTYIPRPKLGSYLLSAAATSTLGGGGKQSNQPDIQKPVGVSNSAAHVSLPWSASYKGAQLRDNNWLNRNFNTNISW